MGKAIATKACQEGIRTRWITYPFLCRELMRLKAENSRKLEARIKYYCGFDLFCIDEFPNYDIEDKFLMQEFFDQVKIPAIQQLYVDSAALRIGILSLK